MDTRQKIVSFENMSTVLAEGEWVAVAGLFDPLTAVQAKRLAEIAKNGAHAGRLLAIVLESEGTLLPAEARAILVAALRDVNAVVIAQPDRWRDKIPESGSIRIIEDSEGERIRSAEFARFVIQRQQSTVDRAERSSV